MLGPGVYDELCTHVREKTEAGFVAVLIIGGNKGDGLSCQTCDPILLPHLPGILRALADDMEKEIEVDSKISTDSAGSN